jgi:hypothetical protein
MRRLLHGLLLLGLVLSSRPMPVFAAAASETAGCLGVTITQCLASLRATMTLDEGFIADAMARRGQVDVNGRPLGGRLMSISGRIPGRVDTFLILLHLRPDDTVGRVEAKLLGSLNDARTEAVYDSTAFYEMVSRLLGRRCPALVRLDLYRFFENSVKPRITQERQDVTGGLLGLHKIISHAAGVPFCGVSFGYTSLIQWRGSADRHAGRDIKNFTSIELQ